MDALDSSEKKHPVPAPISKHNVLISKLHNSPEIHIAVTEKSMGIRLELEDFLKHMSHEMGGLNFSFTKKQMKRKIFLAAIQTIRLMKKETERVM